MDEPSAFPALRGLLAPLERVGRLPRIHLLLRWVLLGVPTACLACLALQSVLEKNMGLPAAPLDDSYIHLQYARNFAHGLPLRYAPDAPPVAGATSLLWPALLAIFHALGLQGESLIWPAWVLGFVSLGLLAHEAERAAASFVAPKHAVFAAALVLCFGANTWFAGSAMEVVPLSWLLLRSVRRAADWWERPESAASGHRTELELTTLAWLAPLMRPEGALGSMAIILVLSLKPPRPRRMAVWAALGVFAPATINWLITGQATTTTMRAKWLPVNPYSSVSSLVEAMWQHIELLFGTLLNGEIWSALFLPKGCWPVWLAAFATLVWRATRGPTRMRAALLLLLALGILIPGTFECPLCNRLRYLWPFFPAWMVGLVGFADLLSRAIERWNSSLGYVTPGLLGAVSGALLGYMPFALQDLGASASAISAQQVALGKWARTALPGDARIGVNDTGAIAYFSERSTFDIVGLTTSTEAEHWTAGPGSRFEHYERLGRAALPTHFIVYPEWFALDELCGEVLNERAVPGATILGGERMVAYRADYSRLGSGETPDLESAQGFRVIDQLDVADLVSERAHDYALLEGAQRYDDLVRFGTRLDGARKQRSRDAFRLDLAPGGRLVLRLGSTSPTWVRVRIGPSTLRAELPASVWHEVVMKLPEDLPAGRNAVSVECGEPFTSMHYFSLVPAK
ncbi:MAG TPA: hypothetical protein VFQ61_18140 [Polyangiaceae bacterium]|nr:hypothetical protein [Polyangiaceae bacterium]